MAPLLNFTKDLKQNINLNFLLLWKIQIINQNSETIMYQEYSEPEKKPTVLLMIFTVEVTLKTM